MRLMDHFRIVGRIPSDEQKLAILTQTDEPDKI
jgi:hypothetical protein